MSALEVAIFTDVFIPTSYVSDVTLTLQECLWGTEGAVVYPESPGGLLGEQPLPAFPHLAFTEHTTSHFFRFSLAGPSFHCIACSVTCSVGLTGVPHKGARVDKDRG